MEGVGAPLARRLHQRSGVQVGLGEGGAGQQDGGVGLTDVGAAGVVGRVHRHGLQAGVVRRRG